MENTCKLCGSSLNKWTQISITVNNKEYFICEQCNGKLKHLANMNAELNANELNQSASELNIFDIDNDANDIIQHYLNIGLANIKASEIKTEYRNQALEEMLAKINLSTEERDKRIQYLKEHGHSYYYEYHVVTIDDSFWGGRVDAKEMTKALNNLGLDGWHLVSSYTNELGKNALMAMGLGVNTTVDEHILIFERKVNIE